MEWSDQAIAAVRKAGKWVVGQQLVVSKMGHYSDSASLRHISVLIEAFRNTM
jgi:hypothetical protein